MILRLLPVLVVVVVIVVVLVVRERAGGAGGVEADGGRRTLRRVFVYSLSLLGALLTASGLSGVLRVAFEAFGGTTLVSETERGLALGLSLTVVGLPVWVMAWHTAQRDSQRSVGERRSSARRLHLGAVRAVSLGVAVPAAIETGLWLVGSEPYEAGATARLLVWGVLWGYHELVAAEVPFGSEHTLRTDRLEAYLTATVAVALLAVSLGSILARSLGSLYELAAGAEVLLESSSLGLELRSAIVSTAVGAALWWWHWLVIGRRDAGSTGWFVHLFLVGVLSGTVAVVVSGSVLLHRVLAWTLAATEEAAAIHFDMVPSALAGLIVGVAVWGYHRAVLRESETAEEGARGAAEGGGRAGQFRGAAAGGGRADLVWSGPERIYRYLVTAAGMLTAAGGIATVLVVGLDLVVPGRTLVQAPGGVRDAVAVGFTLLLIGVPLWGWFWSSTQRHVRADASERGDLARRVLIFAAFGMAIITTVVALSVLLFELFDAMFAGVLAADLIEEQRWSIALLVTAGAIGVHYGLVLREDRAEGSEEAEAVRLHEVIVVAPRPQVLADQLRRRLEVKVTTWQRQDLDPGEQREEELDEIALRLRQAGARRALVIVGHGGHVELVPLAIP